MQVVLGPRKTASAIDVIDIDKQTDEQISETLRNYVRQKKLSFADSRVTVLLPRSRAILRHMVFPSQKDEEILAMINLQVGSHIPYVREEVEIDFQVLSRTPEGYSRVAVVIIPQEIAKRYWKIFLDAKLPVHGISISSIGLWLFYQTQDVPEKAGAIVDMDVDRCEICLCQKSQWLNSREISVGLSQLQQDGCAELLKQWELTQQTSSGEKIFLATAFLVSTSGGSPILRDELASKHPELNVKEVILEKTIPLARGVRWPAAAVEGGVSMVSLAGVALSSETPPIDLIPHEITESHRKREEQRQLIIAASWMAAALVGVGLALGVGTFRKHLELLQLQSQVDEVKRNASGVEEQSHKVDAIEALLRSRLIFSNLASDLSRMLPAQSYLVNMSVTEGNVLSMEGVSSNPVEINQFQKDMVDSRLFSHVSLDYVNKRVTQQGEVDYFKITCTYNAPQSQK